MVFNGGTNVDSDDIDVGSTVGSSIGYATGGLV